MMTQHAENCRRNWGKKDPNCPRCRELIGGAEPRAAWGSRKRAQEQALIKAIKAHDCAKSGCGPVCTFGDW